MPLKLEITFRTFPAQYDNLFGVYKRFEAPVEEFNVVYNGDVKLVPIVTLRPIAIRKNINIPMKPA